MYADDIVVTGNKKKEKDNLKQCLSKEFEKKFRKIEVFPLN